MPFEIIRDDITRVTADAIVNTANPFPIIGAGTDSAIHRAAGPQLLAAREKIGMIPVGSAVQTPAYDLPAKYVLHTVSPAWEDGLHGEEAQLRNAYDAALALADRLHCRSVAFPLLSSGSYGFPKDRALSVAIAAFTDFLLTHELRIILVVFGGDAFSLARGLFGDLKAYINDQYVDQANRNEYGGPSARRRTARNELFEMLSEEKQIAKPKADAEHGAIRDAFREEDGFFPGAAECTAMPRPASTHAAPPVVFAAKQGREAASFACAEKPDDLKDILNGMESTFSEHLLDLLNECGEKDSDVYRRAEISRQLFHKIISKKDYQPTKSTAIQLALGLRLDLAETQKLLEKAGYALTRSSKTDLVVQYFIERGEYSIVVINMALFDCGLPLLKTGSAS